MVQTLASNIVSLSLPSFNKALLFIAFTSRTIPSIAKKSIKIVTMNTLSPFSIQGGNRIGIYKSIFTRSYLPEVVDVNAMPILTGVVYYHTITNSPKSDIICDSMCPSTLLLKVKTTVAVFIQGTLPKMTITTFDPFTVKSFELLFCNHMPIVPRLPLSLQGVNYG